MPVHLNQSIPTVLLLAMVLPLGGGCATSGSTEVRKVRERLEELAQQQAKRQKQLESLNTRLFLLEDKVDTSRVAIERRTKAPAPRLPVVRIRPQDAEPSSEPPSGRLESASRGGGRSLVASEDVEYDGAAARRGTGPRPTLRLHGEQPAPQPVTSGSPSTTRRYAGIDPATVKEKLPVVPVAKGKIARAMAKADPGSSTAMRAYTAALAQYRSGRYTSAAAAFRRFVGRYARHAYADNAAYWLGECFYDLKNYRLALKMFRRVVEQYPNGNKAPAALLKMGFAYLRLHEKQNARTVLAQVVQIFPRSGVARLATRELAKLQ